MNRLKFHVKKGDKVEVISGNFRVPPGRSWKCCRAKQRVLIEGVRIIKKHLRKSQDNPTGKNRGARRPDSHLECEIDRTREKKSGEGREESEEAKKQPKKEAEKKAA